MEKQTLLQKSKLTPKMLGMAAQKLALVIAKKRLEASKKETMIEPKTNLNRLP